MWILCAWRRCCHPLSIRLHKNKWTTHPTFFISFLLCSTFNCGVSFGPRSLCGVFKTQVHISTWAFSIYKLTCNCAWHSSKIVCFSNLRLPIQRSHLFKSPLLVSTFSAKLLISSSWLHQHHSATSISSSFTIRVFYKFSISFLSVSSIEFEWRAVAVQAPHTFAHMDHNTADKYVIFLSENILVGIFVFVFLFVML